MTDKKPKKGWWKTPKLTDAEKKISGPFPRGDKRPPRRAKQ